MKKGLTRKPTPPPLWMAFADFKAAAVMYATHSDTKKSARSAVLQAMDCVESELHASARWSLSAEQNDQILNKIKRRLVLQETDRGKNQTGATIGCLSGILKRSLGDQCLWLI